MNRVSLITIGDEILIGQIVDTNSSWLGKRLTDLGMEVVKRFSVGDLHEDILATLKLAHTQSDLVLITGGLGPTKDDITKQAICEYFGVETYFDEENFEWIKQVFAKYGRQPQTSHKMQCHLPIGCRKLKNRMGTAPGMLMEKDDTTYIFMPGVPIEMKYIFEHSVEDLILTQFETLPIFYRTILTAGIGESVIAERISDVEINLHENLKIAYLPGLSQVRVRVLAKGLKEEMARRLVDETTLKISDILGDAVFGYDEDTLSRALGRLLKDKNKKLTLAESCTGGYIGHLITSEAGASDYFVGSIISYSNELKMKELGVESSTLSAHGAVSEQTVIEMANGALQRYGADIALSVSGIAGPEGGSPEKPVGTIWMCVTDGNKSKTKMLTLPRTRLVNIQQAGIIGLNLIRKFLLGSELA